MNVCSRLAKSTDNKVDICGLERGHEGDHEGKYLGMVFRDTARPGKPRRVEVVTAADPLKVAEAKRAKSREDRENILP